MDIQFKSVEELYNHIKPALRAKAESMHREGFAYIKEEDIWNYFSEIKWSKSTNLRIYQMVDDILNIDNMYIDEYFKKKLKWINRRAHFND